MRAKSKGIIAAAAAAAISGITGNALAQTYAYYRPVVTLVGDGTTAPTTAFGATTAIDAFNYAPSSSTGAGATNQSSPIAFTAYASDASTSSLVTTADSTTEGDLENNPALDDAATAGLPYTGTAYVFSGGYQGSDGETAINGTATGANRVVGYMSVTGNTVSSGTIGSSTLGTAASLTPGTGQNSGTYVSGNLRSAVGDNTPSDGNFWMAGTGTSTATQGFSASFRYANVNVNSPSNTSTELTTSAQNNRRIQIRQGQLYGGSDTGNFVGITLIGNNPNPSNLSGLPTSLTSPGVTALFASGTGQPPSSSANSPLSFVLMDDPNNPNTPTLNVTVGTTTTPVSVPFNTAYIADDNTNGNGVAGIQKWTYNPAGGTSIAQNFGWSLDYVIPDPKSANGNFGLAGELVVNPTNSTLDTVQLFASDNSSTSNANYLVQTTDPLEATTDTAAVNSQVILAGATNENFRGVALAPIVPITAQWNSTSGGNWSASSTWLGTGNNSVSNLLPGTFGDLADTAVFGTVAGAGASTNITLNSARTVGHVLFNSSSTSYTISGSSTLTIDDTGDQSGEGPDITVQAGTHTISTPISLVNGVTANASAGTSLTLSNSISGAGGFASSGAGTVVLSGVNSYTGGTSASAGTLLIEPTGPTTSALPVGALSISGTGKVQLAANVSQGSQSANVPSTAPTSNVNVTSLSITGNGTLDIGNNHIIINYGSGPDPIGSIASWIADGAFGSGTTVTWSGTGITSSSAASNPSYGIGYADSSDAGNPAGLASGQIEVAYTLLGDANLDGKVNGTDFNLMATNFNQAVTNGWDKGDFNYDGKVNGNDFVLLAANFNQFASQSAVSSADVAALDAFAAANGISLTTTSVPEPASIGLLAGGAIGLLARRRARRR